MSTSSALTAVSRRLILTGAQNVVIASIVRRYGHLFGATRFVAGETLDHCVEVIRELNRKGLRANTTLLGEGVDSLEAAEAVVREYQAILDRLARERLRANVALKLSHLGVTLDEDLAYGHLSRLLTRAARHQNFIRIDMEDSPLVDATLRTYRRVRATGHENVGLVLQAYLYRSEADLEALLPLRPNLRIVKGAYLEPPEIAFPRKDDVDANYLRLARRALDGAGYTAIATHDERIIEHLLSYAAARGIDTSRFEIQMLYGVRPGLQQQLVQRGYPVLVATPFGPQWYPYLTRRLAERPANLLFFLRNALRH